MTARFQLSCCGTLFAACLSAPPTAPFTWRDAWLAYMDVWCERAAVCNPEWYAERYATHAECMDAQVTRSCDDPNVTCAGLYPIDRVRTLDTCLDELSVTPCWALLPPSSCIVALIP